MALIFSDRPRNFTSNWVVWYLMRVFVGMAIAFLTCVVVRAGSLNVSGDASEINACGVAAIAGLAGLFSTKIANKLEELVDVLLTGADGGQDAKGREQP